MFDACVAGDALTVSVETKDTSRSCVPGTAAAHVEWPNPAGKLTMLITNCTPPSWPARRTKLTPIRRCGRRLRTARILPLGRAPATATAW
ncbi:MAG: hypothetical protein ACLSVD_04005 [Eggerthellaceae bacterium]